MFLLEKKYFSSISGPNASKHKNCIMGKYAALITFTQSSKMYKASDLFGQQICQHIVGMNPKTIKPVKKEENLKKEEDKKDEKKTEKKKLSKERIEEPEETALLKQEFMLDSNFRIEQILSKNQASVQDFIRFECGEDL